MEATIPINSVKGKVHPFSLSGFDRWLARIFRSTYFGVPCRYAVFECEMYSWFQSCGLQMEKKKRYSFHQCQKRFLDCYL